MACTSAIVLFPLIALASCASLERSRRSGDAGAPPVELHGVWDAVRERIEPDGDLRTERVEWHVHQQGRRVYGFVERALGWRSRDGVPFACSGRLDAVTRSRTVFAGTASGRLARATLGETSAAGPSACEAAHPRPAVDGRACVLEPRGRGRLIVSCGGGAPTALARRLDAPIPVRLALHPPRSLTGVWTWHHRSLDAEGDLKLESEVWQLEQRGSTVEGHYERTVVVRSGDGRRFRCNDELQYSSRARFEVRGEVHGQRLRIRELSFRTVPHRCETGERTLDQYLGTLAPDGAVIRLSWGRGAQLLYRRF